MNKIANDARVHPRIRRIMSVMPEPKAQSFENYEAVMAYAAKQSVIDARAAQDAVIDGLDDQNLAPLDGLDISTHEITSAPDDNTIKISFMRPEDDEPVPVVVYLHGGGMMTMSCFLGTVSYTHLTLPTICSV